MNSRDFDQHPSRALAEFVATTPPERIPDEVTARLRRLVLDWIGITAFAGHHAENAGPVRAAVDNLDAGAGSTVVGQEQTRSLLYAALLNGTLAHSMDFDDTNIVQIVHPGAPVIAAALADAERLDVDMATFYDALALGYEVACRVGAALGPSTYDRGFHITALAGIFGAVAVSARLRGLDAETTGSAFGLALSKAAGSMQYLANGSWNKRLHPGFAAHDGLLCVELAQAGVIGAAEPLEGRYGLLHSYTDDAQPEQLTQELASTWILLQTAIKPYPSCRWTHGPIDAALALRTRVRADQRPHAQIRVWLSPTAYPIVGEAQPRKIRPVNTVDAQFSVYFQVASAWLDGHVDWSTYQRLTDPDIAEIAAHIDVDQDAKLAENGSRLIIDAGGEQIGTTIDVPLGEPGNWISDDRLRDKFERHAGPIYGIPQSRWIAAAVLDEPLSMSIRELAVRLRLPAHGAAEPADTQPAPAHIATAEGAGKEGRHGMSAEPTFGRYAEIPVDQMTPAQRKGYDQVVESRGEAPGPYKIFIENPALMRVLVPVGVYFNNGHSSLSAAEREIAVNLINGHWLAAYSNHEHEIIGEQAGLPPDKVEALIAGLPTSFDNPRQQVIYDITRALIGPRVVPTGLYRRAVDLLGDAGVTDLTTLLGYYTTVSLTLGAYNVPADAIGLRR